MLCASGTAEGTVQVFDARNYECKEIFRGNLTISNHFIDHALPVRALEFSQNNQTLISSGEDTHINLTDVETLKRKLTVTGHSDWVTSLSINNHAKAFVSGSLDG